MAISFVRNIISSGYNLDKLNENFERIATALQDGVSRSGITPNQMNADLDMNSNDVLNAGVVEADSLILNGVVVVPTGTISLPDTVMLKPDYDPQAIEGDAFDLALHTGRVAGNGNLPTMPTATIKGRLSVGTGNGEDLTVPQTVELLGLTYIKDYGSHSVALRKFRSTYVDPSNWTTVLQAAGDSGEPTIRIHADAPVTFQGQWSIETAGQKWVGEGMDNTAYLNRTVDVDEPAILVMGERCGMRHIGIRGTHATVPSNSNNVGILVARPNGDPTDLDFEFRNGYISKFYYAVHGKGRGITVDGSLISAVRYGVNFDWPDVGTYLKDRFVGDQDGNGFRRQVVRNCEFHSISTFAVRNRGWNAANIHCVVENNTSNFGKGIFAGFMSDGSVLQGNSIINANFTGYELDGGTNWVMRNNSMYTDRTASGMPSPDHFIQMTGQHTGFIIDGFQGRGTVAASIGAPASAIDMRDGDFVGVVRAIDLAAIGTNGLAASDGMTVIGTGSATEILVDGFTLRNASAARSVVRMNTAGSVLKHRGIVALGAATPATSGAGTITAV